MLLFQRILDFKQAALARLRDKRKSVRYPVGPGFALKGTVSLRGQASASSDWSGQLANLSPCGASLLLPPAAITDRGEATTLTLTIEQHTLKLPCKVAHFRVLATHATCGLTLEFPDYQVQKGFAQLLEAVRIGATLAPVKPAGRRPAAASVEQYRAGTATRLSVWRGAGDAAIERFEFVLGDHVVRGGTTSPLVITSKDERGDAPGAEVVAEVKRLFRWSLANFGKTVPTDVRDFLRQAAADQRPAPAVARTGTLSGDPGKFPPPRRPVTRPPIPAS